MQVGEMIVLSGQSHPELARSISDFIGTPLGRIRSQRFPDGELFVKIEENIRGKDVFIVQPTCPPVNDNLMELLLMMDAARRASAQRINAVVPFFGYARQDRKDQPRVPISAKLVANLIVTAGADRVITMDLHAPQIQGFFDIPVDHLYAIPVIVDYLHNIDRQTLTIISPDVGGLKMAAAYGDYFGVPFGFVTKRRVDAENVEASAVVGDVEDKDVLLVDDVTESVGTLMAAARVVREHGARSVRAAVSHGLLTDTGYDRLTSESHLDELITTDSTPVDPKGLPVTVLSVAPLLSEAIMRINNHQSVTSLFRLKSY